MAYSKKVVEKFENTLNNPEAFNVGRFDPKESNVGTGMVGAPACGDVMKLQIKCEPKGNTHVINDVKFNLRLGPISRVGIAINKPKSARAVANACAKNPYAPNIPCHRVIRSDGGLGGYSGRGGVDQKLKLLRSEKVDI